MKTNIKEDFQICTSVPLNGTILCVIYIQIVLFSYLLQLLNENMVNIRYHKKIKFKLGLLICTEWFLVVKTDTPSLPCPPTKMKRKKKIEIWKLKCFNKGFESSNSSCGVTLSHSIHWYNETPYYKGSSLNSIYNLKSRASAKQILHF